MAPTPFLAAWFRGKKYPSVIFVEKAACTSLRDALQHIPFEWVPYEEYKDFNHLWCVVRNPFTRLVSCYIYKLKIQRRFDPVTTLEEFGFTPEMDFKHFVERVCALPDEKSDRHFRSQGFQIPNHTRIFRLEEQDWSEWEATFPGFTMPHVRKSGVENHLGYYTPATMQMVYERYIDDFKRFYPEVTP